jgi:hypothetical protein
MARCTRRVWRWWLGCAGAVGKTARWSLRAVACSCISKEEGTKGGGEAPTEVKPTACGAKLTGEGGAVAAPRQFPMRGDGIQCQKVGTWPHKSQGEGKGLQGG